MKIENIKCVNVLNENGSYKDYYSLTQIAKKYNAKGYLVANSIGDYENGLGWYGNHLFDSKGYWGYNSHYFGGTIKTLYLLPIGDISLQEPTIMEGGSFIKKTDNLVWIGKTRFTKDSFKEIVRFLNED